MSEIPENETETVSSYLKPGPSIRIEARAMPGAGSATETINTMDNMSPAEEIGRALGSIIRNAWYLAADIDRDRGDLNAPGVVQAILDDWTHDEYEVCLRCGENCQGGPGPACSLCGFEDVYREADGDCYRREATLQELVTEWHESREANRHCRSYEVTKTKQRYMDACKAMKEYMEQQDKEQQ